MRKLIISLAAAGAALVVASPASAQYYGGQPYGYGQGYGYNGYGYNNFGQVQSLQARIDALQYRIRMLDRYNGGDRTERLRKESRNIERRLQQASRYGLSPYEASDIQMRIARLESQVQYASMNGYGYGRGYNGYGYNGYGYNGYSGYGYNNGRYESEDRDDWDHHGDRDDDDNDD